MASTADKIRAVAEHYAVYSNKQEALRHAGYSESYVKARGYKVFDRQDVKQAIEDVRARIREERKPTVDKIIDEMAKIATADPTDIVKIANESRVIDGETVEYQTVTVKNTDELTPDQRAAIKSIKQTRYGIVIEFYSKTEMLTKLGEYLGIFKQNINLTGKIEGENPYQGLTTDELKALIASKGRG